MSNIKVKIKRLSPDSVVPSYAHDGDACMDLTAISKTIVEEDGYGYLEYGFGWAFEIPAGYVMELYPRSSISNTGLILVNGPGQIDSTFRGEVKARFKWVKGSKAYEIGDRAVQFKVVPYPTMEMEEVEELSETTRGEGGFGSTNVK